MKNHIIIEKSKKYDISNYNLTPIGCAYNIKKGFWVEIASNIAMMKNKSIHIVATKKCDIETGEDQKGE